MNPDDRTAKLLEEIRDVHTEHLAEYRRVTRISLDLQRAGAARQEQVARLYKGVMLFGGVMVAALLSLLVYLLVRWSAQLFG